MEIYGNSDDTGAKSPHSPRQPNKPEPPTNKPQQRYDYRNMTEPQTDQALETRDALGAKTIADGIEHRLEPVWIKLQYVQTAIALCISTPIFAAAIAGASVLDSTPASLVPVLWTLLGLKLLFNIVKGYLWPKFKYRYASYLVDENGVQVRSGFLNRTVTSVPRSRVQHVDLSQGVWERRFGIATLTIHTAASRHSTVDLEGVTPETAARIRDYLLPQGNDDAV